MYFVTSKATGGGLMNLQIKKPNFIFFQPLYSGGGVWCGVVLKAFEQ